MRIHIGLYFLLVLIILMAMTTIVFADGDLTPYEKEEKWGFVNSSGKLVVPCTYDWVEEFNQGVALVKRNSKYGFVNASGKEIAPCVYDNTTGFLNGYAVVVKGGKWGCIDTLGKEIVPCIYDKVTVFYNGIAAIVKDNKYGFINKQGVVLQPCVYDIAMMSQYFDGFLVIKGYKSGFVDYTGKEVVPCQYSEILSYENGYAAVRTGTRTSDKWGVIDSTGKVVVPNIYNFTKAIRNGYLAVMNGDEKWGFVDMTGKEIVPLIYDDADIFENGYACVKKDEYWGIVNTESKEILPCVYGRIETYGFSKSYITVYKDGTVQNIEWDVKKISEGTFTPVKISVALRWDEPIRPEAQAGDTFIKPDGTKVVLKVGPHGILGEGQGVATDLGRVHKEGFITQKVTAGYRASGSEFGNHAHTTYRVNKYSGEGHWSDEWMKIFDDTKPTYKGKIDEELSKDKNWVWIWTGSGVWRSGDWYFAVDIGY